jgi:lipopolysaccharide biosynthesis protein
MCHIFYPALASEMFHYLRRLPGQADLLVTTDSEEKRVRLQDVLGGWDAGALEIKVTPNRGRDIGPKLIAWAERYRDYDLVLHLHSKRSDHADFLAPWRSFLLENLLGSAPVVASIYDAFDRLPELGMVASQHYEAIRPWLAWNGNFAQAQQLARRMGFSLSRKRALDFPSGSMFWVRPAALQPLLDLGLAFTDFPEEGSQLDETPAHAIERLYFMICEHAGFNWLKVGQRALFMDTAPILPVASPEALGSFLKAHGVSLNGANAMPPAPMPPRLVTRVPPGLKQRLEQRYF